MIRAIHLVAVVLAAFAFSAAAKPNVLFLSADDLRVEPLAKTPNLDRLAARARVFTNAHCQQAVCNPSRASVFTGRRPDTLKVWDLVTHFRDTAPDAVTLPQFFKSQGYTSIGIGKNFHNWLHGVRGDPASWSAPEEFHWGRHDIDKPQGEWKSAPNLARFPGNECREVPDDAYLDGRIAGRAIERLEELGRRGEPFFLSVGFWKPHRPFNAPKKYWDLYKREDIPTPDPSQWPEGTDRLAWHPSPEIRGWDRPRDLSGDEAIEMRHGYLAATSYLDAQVGRLLDALERLGLAEETIVVFWSDHGFHLGERELWGKSSNFELDTRVPLMIAAPDFPDPGAKAAAPVELLDLYPTLADLAGLPALEGTEGKSLRPLLDDPDASVKDAALSQFPRPAYFKGEPLHMGYSARGATHRYTEWRDWRSGEVRARELYDHRNDPRETRNLAADPAMASLANRLSALLPVAAPRAPGQAPPPGTLIHHSPASSGLYIGSPSLCIAPDGSYLASHDLFGPKSREHERAKGRLYRSTDRGESWRHVRDFEDFFWTGLFVHRGKVFLMGTDKHHGRMVIRSSEDSGGTWSEPAVLLDGQWHTAPMPAVEHGGRLWRAVEDAHTSAKWGERYRARMMSASVSDDLLDPSSWTVSNAIAGDPTWLENDFAAWLEGNAVVAPDGGVVNVLRVDTSRLPEKAAMVRLSKDGRTASFDPRRDFLDLPGGSKKFTIRKDPEGPGYWTLASIIPERHHGAGRPAAIRNTLALLHSDDLRSWEVRSILLYHPDVVRHGFQYVDWQFDGEDLIAACRTAWEDAEGGARNHHDANFMTFHRWRSFRTLDRKDDVPMPEFIGRVAETASLTLRGGFQEIAKLESGAKAFSNRGYHWQDVPVALAGKSFTRLDGGAKAILEVSAKRDTVVRMATATGQSPLDLEGWTDEGTEFSYDDPGGTKVRVLTRPLKKGGTLRLPLGNWTGSILILDDA